MTTSARITSVLTKLSTSKTRLEKVSRRSRFCYYYVHSCQHDLTKKRTCTLGLHGPWGESSSVFIRISFWFPKTYPHPVHPEGTPEIDLERTPLISIQNRAFMLRRLKTIRERRRPCLEACLRFLLFGDENEQVGIPVDMRSESSSEEDEGPTTRKSRDFTVSLLRNNKNLAEPRTSQGVFGPNGRISLWVAYHPFDGVLGQGNWFAFSEHHLASFVPIKSVGEANCRAPQRTRHTLRGYSNHLLRYLMPSVVLDSRPRTSVQTLIGDRETANIRCAS